MDASEHGMEMISKSDYASKKEGGKIVEEDWFCARNAALTREHSASKLTVMMDRTTLCVRHTAQQSEQLPPVAEHEDSGHE